MGTTRNLEQTFIHLHPVGLGVETAVKPFHYPETNTGVGRVLPVGTDGSFKVKIQPLDDFVKELNPTKISFVKMIVEGFEPEVIKGGLKTLEKYKPTVFFEVTKEWYEENNSSVEEVLNILRGVGYGFKGEYYNEMIPYDPAKFSELYQYNLLAEFKG